MMTKNIISDRVRLARTIIICHATLIGVVVFLYVTDSLLNEEFTPLLTLLLPVTSLYAGTVFRYIGDKIKKGAEFSDDPTLVHYSLVRWLIVGHFIVMFLLVISKAVFNWIEFSLMVTLMTLVETTFGGYMGSINSAIFEDKEKNKTPSV